MALQKQIHLYSVDTSFFYNINEVKIAKKLSIVRKQKTRLKKIFNKCDTSKQQSRVKKLISKVIKKEKEYKQSLISALESNKDIRSINQEKITDKCIVSMFESTLSRTLQIPENAITTDLFIVQAFYFDVLEDLILDGFMYNDEKYICFTASAGQIRTKKTVFIKEKFWNKYHDTLMCGLSIEKINAQGGVNINKFLAYLALCNSATDEWIDFDIRKAIVVEDMETVVTGVVDFIDDVTYEITRKEMSIPICHTDGCGIILPCVSQKSFMTRLPWVKGLLVPFPYDNFIKEKNCSDKVVDIYGKEWDLIKDDIQIIFTKSQFKMWKYYKDWAEYQNNFIKYNCQAGICNLEEDYFDNAKINYQMLQTLSDITNSELNEISSKARNDIIKIGSNRKTMLKVFGVTKSNANKTYLQQAIEVYPDLLCDVYCRKVLQDIKKSLVKQGRSAKFEIDCTYTFLIPDLYAFCEYLFLGNKNPKGLLKDGQVYCNLFNNEKEVDCLRSPHLFREHAVRNNVIDEEKSKWFITNGIYTSGHDLISKILMFDNDGDKSLVVSDPLFVQVAKRNMKNIVPLYYNMKKAGAEIISNQSIYNGLKLAYTGGNIGVYSNNITKIWNSDNINLDVIKWLCMENNFTIDYAKTLYKPTRPKKMKSMIQEYTKLKVPNFFVYAKDKNKNQVENHNNSVINRLHKFIPNKIINFKLAEFGRFNYENLMQNKDIELDENIINKYLELDLKKHFMFSDTEDEDYNNITYTYQKIKFELLCINPDAYYITDVLIKYLYKEKRSQYKDTLWLCFGDIIVENLKRNIKEKYIYCEKCGTLVEYYNNKKYCKDCSVEEDREKAKERMRNIRNVRS